MSDNRHGLTYAIGTIAIFAAAKAAFDYAFVLTLQDNENAWYTRAQRLSESRSTEAWNRLDQKRQRAQEWINMTTMERLVRLPPFECLKR